MMRTIISTAVVVILFMPMTAAAGQSSTARATETQWAIADKCNRTAIAKYPDHTSEALAKRDRDVRQCLLAYRLEARTPLSQPQAPQN
jgi:hypothetical protein